MFLKVRNTRIYLFFEKLETKFEGHICVTSKDIVLKCTIMLKYRIWRLCNLYHSIKDYKEDIPTSSSSILTIL